MERLLIGSSNVAGFYDPSKFKEYPPYKMIKCTKVELFRVAVETIKDEKEVIISVIENFLCDAIRSLKDPTSEQIDSMVEGVLDDYVGVVKKAAIRLPNTRFALAQPILRPAHNWYMERFEGFCKLFINKVNSTGLENISKLDTLSRMSQSFTADGIHLTADSGRSFINMLLFNAENFFETEVINLDEDPDRREPDRQHTVFAKGLKNLEKTLKEINCGIFKRRFNDNLVMARLREDVDVISNEKKEDKMIITGLSSRVPRPMGTDEAKQWLKNIVAELLDKIENGVSSQIVFVTQGRSRDREVPLAEVRMKDKGTAIRLRKRFAQQKKAGQDFGRVQIMNCVTLATRVRIDILKAMAKKFTTEREDLFVYGYASRPVLHIKPKDGNKRPMWLSFSDALTRFGAGLGELDLGEAYRRAGVAFRGQLQQNFVVLHETGAENEVRLPPKASTSAGLSTPKKRVRDELGAEPESKTPKKQDVL